MITDYFERMSFDEREYYWSYINSERESNEFTSIRIIEIDAYNDIYKKGIYMDFFESDNEPLLYFVPLEIMEKTNDEIIDWCENNCIYTT